MRNVLLSLSLLLLCAASPNAACSKKNPCPVITFNPAMPTELDNTPVGTVITQVVVTLNPSNAGQFTGTLSFGSPYGNDNGILALSGHDIVLARSFPVGNSTQNSTIIATQ